MTVKYLTFLHCMGPYIGTANSCGVVVLFFCFFCFFIWFSITVALNYSLGSKSHFSFLFSFSELERIETIYKETF